MKRGGNMARGARPITFAFRVRKLTEYFLPGNPSNSWAFLNSLRPEILASLLEIQNLRTCPPRDFSKLLTRRLRRECAYGIYNGSACARVSSGVREFVRRKVGTPTDHACPGNGSHYPEDISTGRGGPPGQLSRAVFRPRARSGRRSPTPEESLWLYARGSLSRAALVRREGNPGVGAHPTGRVARILSQGAKRLW